MSLTSARLPLLLAFGLAALTAASADRAHAGCSATGYGGTVIDSECTYVEENEGANVYVVAQAHWMVISVRSCPVLSQECSADTEDCTEPCEPVLEEDRCTPAPENQCKQATTAAGALRFFEREIVVAEGGTLPLEQPIHAATKPGDTVIARMLSDEAGQGPWGFMSVGQDDEFYRTLGVTPPQ